MTTITFSLGPVQGFVAQSRRTRDLWGSSYLLSYLAGQAMRGAESAGKTTIVRPLVQEDPLYAWIAGRGRGEPPRLGSLPNQFSVETEREVEGVARAAESAYRSAWERICLAVRDRFLPGARPGTLAIWQRQTEAFWDLVWVAGPPEGGLLARRKHWRTHALPEEPGDKCTIMHDLQELSGFTRAGARSEQDGFWEAVRGRTGALDLREDERLSAIALVKRMFARVSEQALGWPLDAARWPSTLKLAAVPWVTEVERRNRIGAEDYAGLVRASAPPGAAEASTPPALRAAGTLARLDANYLQPAFVRNQRLCPLRDESARERLCAALDALQKTVGPPSMFYAMLLADGDRLGRLVAELGSGRVGEALARFTARVPEVVESHDGVTVYAGGDDVLAMLALPKALDCAQALAKVYRESFDTPQASLSAAVVLAHARLPLGAVLRRAHWLLDRLAKEQNGRDSLAVEILKPGGNHGQWVTTWLRPSRQEAVARLNALVARLKGGQAGLSSGLIYRARKVLGLLSGWPRWEPGACGKLSQGIGLETLEALLKAEILESWSSGPEADSDLQALALAELATGLLPLSRNRSGGEDSPEVSLDALILARFLAGKEASCGP